MTLVVLSGAILLVSVVCWVVVLVHAFSRSLGTGFMVLGIPVYNIVYGFTQFEHQYKGAVLAGWLGGFVVAVVLQAFGLAMP